MLLARHWLSFLHFNNFLEPFHSRSSIFRVFADNIRQVLHLLLFHYLSVSNCWIAYHHIASRIVRNGLVLSKIIVFGVGLAHDQELLALGLKGPGASCRGSPRVPRIECLEFGLWLRLIIHLPNVQLYIAANILKLRGAAPDGDQILVDLLNRLIIRVVNLRGVPNDNTVALYVKLIHRFGQAEHVLEFGCSAHAFGEYARW